VPRCALCVLCGCERRGALQFEKSSRGQKRQRAERGPARAPQCNAVYHILLIQCCIGVLGPLGRRERSELRAAKPHAERRAAEHPVSNSPAGGSPSQPNAAVCPPMPPPSSPVRADLLCSRFAWHLACWCLQPLQWCVSSSRSVRAFALPSLPLSV
jgi:hypothetical protein